MMSRYSGTGAIPRFDRDFMGSDETFSRIGGGSLGGKAAGLIFVADLLARRIAADRSGGIDVVIPRLTVVGTDHFDAFMEDTGVREASMSGDSDARIALAFQHASLPPDLVGDLRALIEQVHAPLAVRSSSLLEDALEAPFAGVYGTKMIPNNEHDPDARFRKLTEAIKFVWASTFFAEAVDYRRVAGREAGEKMAVIIQEVVGTRRGNRFYPELSGVARSYNYYPTGNASPDEGVVQLALGLGKTIVDGEPGWTYSPAWPRSAPPFDSTRELIRQTQCEFWAVNMGPPPEYDPIAETEYLVRGDLADAEADGALAHVVSTYDAAGDRLSAGMGRPGPRVVNFAPLLAGGTWEFNEMIRALLSASEEALGADVEIEFAMTMPDDVGGRARLGFLQVRPMAAAGETPRIEPRELECEEALVASSTVMGNGCVDTIRDIVYVKPDVFDAGHTREIASEIAAVNRDLVRTGRPYLLIGFGRWGSQDPWLGIPVNWAQIGGARAIVEATLPTMRVEPSQGSHFFHNITSFGICYFSVPHLPGKGIDWAWLAGRTAAREERFVRHVVLSTPLTVKVDGKSGRGVVLRGRGE